MFGSQVTNKQTATDPLLLEPFACNKETIHSDTLCCLSYLPSVAVVTLCRSVLKEDDILCGLCADACSDVSDNSDNEILDSDSDVPTTSSRKQLPSSAIVVTSDSETSTEEEESSVLESCDDKTSDVWCTADKKPSNEHFLGTTGLHTVIDNPESVVVQSLVMLVYSYLLNSLTFTIVKMHRNGKSRLKH